MKYVVGCVNYADQESVNRNVGQLIHRCLTQFNENVFEDYYVEHQTHWITFRLDLLQQLDVSDAPDLQALIQAILDPKTKAPVCEVCGRIGLNFLMIYYREVYGNVGRGCECRDCRHVETKDLSLVKDLLNTQGISGLVTYYCQQRLAG